MQHPDVGKKKTILVVKMFGARTCQLCLQEKMETVEASNKHPEKSIKSGFKI